MEDTEQENLGQFQHLEEDGSNFTPDMHQKCNFFSPWLSPCKVKVFTKIKNLANANYKVQNSKGFLKVAMCIGEFNWRVIASQLKGFNKTVFQVYNLSSWEKLALSFTLSCFIKVVNPPWNNYFYTLIENLYHAGKLLYDRKLAQILKFIALDQGCKIF